MIPSRPMLRAWIVAVALAAGAAPADAYEFWLRTQTTGQAYHVRDDRLVGPSVRFGRRRFTQSLALRIWDVGDLAAARRSAHLPERGPRISWQSYLRIDHDFGDYTSGRITLPRRVPVGRDALDVIPELADSVASLQVLYGYLELAGLFDDRLTVQLGRLVGDAGWGAAALDGATARIELPQLPIAVTTTAGFAVRASSPVASAAYELDGTSGAACQEYVEGPSPGTGTWQLIDRSRAVTNRRLSSDYEFCPQREVRQPTVGVSIATSRIHGFGAELGYRRTWSDTVGLIGPVDRLGTPDRGLYPDELGQAPATGLNEERLWARAHGQLRAAGLDLAPYADLRYSVLHALVDRAALGVRLSRGPHTFEPAVEYFAPTFEGDSIFNAFSIEPTTDLRLGYQLAGLVTLRATGWLRSYRHTTGGASFAGGADAGIDHPIGPRRRLRVDLLWDDGYGGRRLGGSAELGWRTTPTLWLRGRAIVLGVARDDPGQGSNAHPRYVTASTVTSATWQVADTVALHTILELSHDAIHQRQLRTIATLDFAFAPEP
jgi:hypothetical protein